MPGTTRRGAIADIPHSVHFLRAKRKLIDVLRLQERY
jgi:hypothetical protein